MRLALFGEGPLYEAVEAALHDHTIVGRFRTPQPTEVLRDLQVPLAVSAGYRHKFTYELDVFPILNVHTGYLPWNRGAYPNVWPFLDGSPAGTTVHWVDEGWDTGPIVNQRKVPVTPTDTAYTLQPKLIQAGVELIRDTLDHFDAFGVKPGKPQEGKGSFHRKKDAAALQGHKVFGAEHRFYSLLRAFTFPPYGFDLTVDDKTIRATITLTEVKE